MRYSRQWCWLLSTLGLLTLCLAFFHSALAAEDPVCLEWTNTTGAGNVAFSPDGKWIAARNYEEAIVWDFATKDKVATFVNPCPEPFDTIIFSPDSQQLAYLDDAGHVGLWDGSGGWDDAPKREILGPPVDRRGREINNGHGGSSQDMAFSPDGKLLAVRRREAVAIVEVDTGKIVGELKPRGFPQTLQFADQGKLLMVSAGGNERHGQFVEFWSMATLEVQDRLRIEPSRVAGTFYGASALLAPGEDRLAVLIGSPTTNTELRLYELPSRRWVTLATDRRMLYCPAFSPDGRLLAIGTMQTPNKPAEVLVRDLKANAWRRLECPPDVAQENKGFWTPKFSPDGRYLAAGVCDHPQVAVCIWDLQAETDASKSSRSRN